MYEVEQVEHRNDADWSGYNMLHTLLAEQEIRRAKAVADLAAFNAYLWGPEMTAQIAAADQRKAQVKREKHARAARKGWQTRRFNAWLWGLSDAPMPV
jgi:hypothetical protein